MLILVDCWFNPHCCWFAVRVAWIRNNQYEHSSGMDKIMFRILANIRNIRFNCRYVYEHLWILIIEGSLEVKLPTIWTVGKAEVGRVREEKKRSEKMQVREKVGKSRFTVFFQWFVAQEGRKVGSLKRRVRSQLARWEMKDCTPLWREAHLEVKKAKDTSRSDHFWKLRCRKSARPCGAKQISKSKGSKTDGLGPLLEVHMSKECTTLWRETHFQVKSVKKLTRWDHFWKFRCLESARRCGAKHISKSKVSKNWRARTTFGSSDV